MNKINKQREKHISNIKVSTSSLSNLMLQNYSKKLVYLFSGALCFIGRMEWRHNTQHDIQPNNTQHMRSFLTFSKNNTQYNNTLPLC
jgi:hypothetical protein